jgi:hypothetical protein
MARGTRRAASGRAQAATSRASKCRQPPGIATGSGQAQRPQRRRAPRVHVNVGWQTRGRRSFADAIVGAKARVGSHDDN